jgi:hypothetical protein
MGPPVPLQAAARPSEMRLVLDLTTMLVIRNGELCISRITRIHVCVV